MKNNKKGFTLIELIIVIAILGILTALAAPRFLGYTKDANVLAMKNDAKTLSNIAMTYRTEHDQGWPTTDETVELNGKTLHKLDETVIRNQYTSLKNPISEYALDEATGDVYHILGVADKNGDTWFNGDSSTKTPMDDPTGDSGTGGGDGNNEDPEVVAVNEYYDFDPATGTITTFYASGRNYDQPAMVDVMIPSEFGGVPVVAIGDYAFMEHGYVNSVTIPEGVVSIGDGAFTETFISEINVPDSVRSIGAGAFSRTAITEINIPHGVTTIGPYTFEETMVSNVVLPSTVTTIGAFAFRYTSLGHITIPHGVTSIEDRAFYYAGLTSVVIPETVTTIAGGAFAGNKLTSVVIPSGVTVIEDGVFRDNNLTDVTIPEGVTHIGQGAFAKNNLTRIVIPESVQTFGSFGVTEIVKDNGPDKNSNRIWDLEPGTFNLIDNNWVKE